jgi:hypothetical protein
MMHLAQTMVTRNAIAQQPTGQFSKFNNQSEVNATIEQNMSLEVRVLVDWRFEIRNVLQSFNLFLMMAITLCYRR